MIAEPLLEQRVTNLEQLMAELITTVNRTSRELREFKNEMREFKDEMSEFKDEMSEFKNEMSEFKNEMIDFKNEMIDFKDEMRDYKDETNHALIKMRQQWGELSNRLGTMVEDLVAPSIGRILSKTIGCSEEEIVYSAVRVRRRNTQDHTQQEFDAIAVAAGHLLINQTKSRLRPDDIPEFIELLQKARLYFSEYADHKIIGVIASLYVDPSLVRHGERQGLVVLGFGDDVMQILNSPEFVLKTF